ncbi:hypothetical protein HK101_003439, partial [Irineochytrium annulatum]
MTVGSNLNLHRYRRVWVGLHFLFILFNCFVVTPTAAIVDIAAAHERTGITAATIRFALVLAAVSLPVWLWATICACSPKVEHWSQRRWERITTRRNKFWMWVLSNLAQGIAWTILTVVFWNPNWICTNEGDGAKIWPFWSTCDEITNIWIYALFNMGAIFFNVIFIVKDELTASIADARRLVENEVADVMRDWEVEDVGKGEDEGVEIRDHVVAFHGGIDDRQNGGAEGWGPGDVAQAAEREDVR